MPRLRALLAPFLAGLERRLARELARLHCYHRGLAREAETRGARPGVDRRQVAGQLEAVSRQHRAKVADLERRYAGRRGRAGADGEGERGALPRGDKVSWACVGDVGFGRCGIPSLRKNEEKACNI